MIFYNSYLVFEEQTYFVYTFTGLNCQLQNVQDEKPKSQQKQPRANKINPREIQISEETITKELKKKHSNSKLNLWTEQQDRLLLSLVESQIDWMEISRNFQNKNELICKRRYHRLKRVSQKWPRQNEQMIKYLCQVQKKPWREIQKYFPSYTKKQIKQRYKNFLQVDIKRAYWNVEQDVKLWKLVKQFGHSWVKFTKILVGRSQLQLKNRYNKFIRPLQLKILEKLKKRKD